MSELRVVLVRPQRAANVGAIARVMTNFGLRDWVVVSPGFNPEDARKVATHAHDVMDALASADSLDEAVRDCAWVVGTAGRRVKDTPRTDPEAFARDAALRPGRVALVFGAEADGLRADEVRRCDTLSVIPTSEDQPSMNLAQAATVHLWSWRLQAVTQEGPGQAREVAPDAQLQLLEQVLEGVLQTSGFLRDGRQQVIRDLARTLRRAQLSPREANQWMAALRSLVDPPSR